MRELVGSTRQDSRLTSLDDFERCRSRHGERAFATSREKRREHASPFDWRCSRHGHLAGAERLGGAEKGLRRWRRRGLSIRRLHFAFGPRVSRPDRPGPLPLSVQSRIQTWPTAKQASLTLARCRLI